MLDLQKPEHIMKFDIPRKPFEMTVRKIFLDSTGKHLLLNFAQGETWYLHRNWKKPKLLKRLSSSKLIIESVAWNRIAFLSSNSAVTGPFLIGTSTGAIYETNLDAGDDFFKSQEKFLKLLFANREGDPVVGLGFELFPPSDIKKCLIVAVTPSRVYQFSGLQSRSGDASESFQSIFAKYKDNEPSS
jgi:vacuolar protein sorting-associated protein 18